MAGSYDPVPVGITQAQYEFATGHSSSGGANEVSYSDSFKPTTNANQAEAVASNRARAAAKRESASATAASNAAKIQAAKDARAAHPQAQNIRMPLPKPKPAPAARPQSPTVRMPLPLPAFAAPIFRGVPSVVKSPPRTLAPSRITAGTEYVDQYGRTRTVPRAGDVALPPGVRPKGVDRLFSQTTAGQLFMNSWQTQATPVTIAPTRGSSALSDYQSVFYKTASTPVQPQGNQSSSYTIKAGDTLSSIASRMGTTVAALQQANGIKDANKIFAGDTIQITGSGQSSSNSNSATSAIERALSLPTSTEGPEWDAYYARVKGQANYFSGGKRQGDIHNVKSTTYQSVSGKKFNLTVNPDAEQAFLGFLGDLEATGYDIQNIGSQVVRNKRGSNNPSEHSYGSAIDINGEIVEGEAAARNQYGKNLVTDLPDNVSEMAAKWGLSWGGDWTSVKDAMHFEYTGNQPFVEGNHDH